MYNRHRCCTNKSHLINNLRFYISDFSINNSFSLIFRVESKFLSQTSYTLHQTSRLSFTSIKEPSSFYVPLLNLSLRQPLVSHKTVSFLNLN